MQSPRSFRRHLPLRWLTLLTVVALATAALVSPAAADPPLQYQFTFTASGDVDDLCPFPIHVDGVADITGTDFYDNSGMVVRSNWHVVEQDIFTANGTTLVGLPYVFNGHWYFDNSGAWTHIYSSGIMTRVPLPDGGMFFGAGHFDWDDHRGASFVFIPDHGHVRNLDAFCAALAP